MSIETVYDRYAEGATYSYSELSRRYADTLPQNARTFTSVGAAVRAIKKSGSHYFDRKTVQTFHSITYPLIYGGRFFVESVKYGHDAVRFYRVLWVSERDDGYLSVEQLGNLPTQEDARRAARALAAAVSELSA